MTLTPLSEWLDTLQYRMAECIFRPRQVVSLIWRSDKSVSTGYLWAIALILFVWLGWGAVLSVTLGNPEYFGPQNSDSAIFLVAQIVLLIWLLGCIYLLLFFIVMMVVRKLRAVRRFFSKRSGGSDEPND